MKYVPNLLILPQRMANLLFADTCKLQQKKKAEVTEFLF